MRAVVLAIAVLSVAAVRDAHAREAPTTSANSPWHMSMIPGINPACILSGLVGQGELSLVVLGAVPGVVHLQLDKRGWSLAAGRPVRAISHFPGYADVSLTALPGGSASLLFNLTSADLPAWMHGFTAGQRAIIEFPDSGEPAWSFDLHGTSPGINAMQQCISSQNIAGVPAPFVSATIPPVVAPGRRCLAYDPAIAVVTGTIRMATGYGPPGFGEDPRTDPRFEYAQLVLDRPACVTGGKTNDFDDIDRVRAMELFPADRGKVLDTAPWVGRHVRVVGVVERKQVASEAATDLYVNVHSLGAAP